MTDFKTEYKSAMDGLTPDSEFLKRLAAEMELQRDTPIQRKSFFSRHRTILTTAAALIIVLGAFSVGAAIVFDMNQFTTSGSSADNAAAEGIYNGEAEDIESNEMPFDKNTAPPAAVDEDSADSVMEADGSGAIIDIIKETAIMAYNGTLTLNDLMQLEYTAQSTENYTITCLFSEKGSDYILTAVFEKSDPDLKPTLIYITESDKTDITVGINLIRSGDRLEDYFNGAFSEAIE